MAATNVDEFINRICDNWGEINKNAAKSAANKAQKDIRKKADQFIGEYYEYPTKYDRQYALYNMVEDYYVESGGSGSVTIKFGVKYDPSKLGQHSSNSWYRQSGTTWIPRLSGDFDFDSANNGMPSSTWIADKFWEGIHPSGRIGDNGGASEVASDTKMQKFFDSELGQIIDGYFQDALFSEMSKYF